MTGLDDAIAVTKASYVDKLLSRGFERVTPDDIKEVIGVDIHAMYDIWPYDDIDDEIRERLKVRATQAAAQISFVGQIKTRSGSQTVIIWLLDGFPFSPPLAFPRSDFPRSWHRNRDGTACLYPGDERGGLPWLDLDEFFSLLRNWFEESESGWTGDFPLLDIEAYIPQSSSENRLVIYGDLSRLNWVKFQVHSRTIRLDGPGRCPAESLGLPSATRYGYVVDIGEPEAPPRDWDDLTILLGRRAASIKRAIRGNQIDILAVQYRRGDFCGVLLLEVKPEAVGKGIKVASLRGASSSIESVMLRAGEFAPQLNSKRVLVIGAGAVGSHVADSLARAGVGTLAVMDLDDVKPGNLVRHIATDRHVGWSKPTAVRDVIESRLFNVTQVEAIEAYLLVPDRASEAIRIYDLVVDATANGSVTAMLHHAAIAERRHVVSVCLKENGAVARVDVLPPLEGEPLPEPAPSLPGTIPVGYEAGCYSAVSLTPHAAVAEAAALATRYTLRLLLGLPVDPAGVQRDYR